MALNKDDILKIINLARLSPEHEDLEQSLTDFNNILAYVETLERVDVEGLEPLAHVHDSSNVMRVDQVTATLSTEDALSNAPERSGDFMKVPLIIETEED